MSDAGALDNIHLYHMYTKTPAQSVAAAADAGNYPAFISFKRESLEYAWYHTNHEFHETCHSVTFYFMEKDSKRCPDTTRPESIHTKDESKRGSAFAFIFGVN